MLQQQEDKLSLRGTASLYYSLERSAVLEDEKCSQDEGVTFVRERHRADRLPELWPPKPPLSLPNLVAKAAGFLRERNKKSSSILSGAEVCSASDSHPARVSIDCGKTGRGLHRVQ